ncbi:TPA: hypothetical protein KAD15_003060 [Escherichia coli]|nr:hypothetical protein [Escherichia coli]
MKTVAAFTFLTFIFSSSAFSQENSIERVQRVSTELCSKAEDYDLCMLDLSMALGAAYQDGLIVAGCKLGLDEPSKDKCENSERFQEYIIKEIRNYAKKDVNSYKGNNRLSPVIILHAIRLTLIQFSPV